MTRFRLSQCPYCGKKLNPFHSWYLKTQGEYLCPKCGGISNIIMDPLVYILGCAAFVIALVVFIVTRISGNIFSFSVLWWIVVPFLLFSVLCAFLVRLKKPILRKKTPDGKKGAKRKEQTIRGMNINGMQYVSGIQDQQVAQPHQAVPRKNMQETQRISFDLSQVSQNSRNSQESQPIQELGTSMKEYLAEDPYAPYAAHAQPEKKENDQTVQFDLPKNPDDIWK